MRKLLDDAAVVKAMRQGQALLYCGGDKWSLTDGRRVKPEIAAIVVRRPDIAGAGDCLFPDHAFAQTYVMARGPCPTT